MQITHFLSLLGGLALFLYGMQMMSTGLEATAGNKMKEILEKLTSNRILGVLVGAAITAVIQSSSATTVMVVGFVNSGLMTLQQAVWIIMGANIGTTITGQLIALDVGVLAPLFAFVGVVMAVFLKGPKVHSTGQIIAGLGVLFIGMGMMSDSMLPLRDTPAFVNLMTQFSNPILGILAGMIFTAIIQSSSASVGILQALATSGVIGLGSAVYVLFGQNIGTCITAVLASIGTNRSAKRTTIIHLMFNLIGTALFVTICLTTPFVSWMESMTPAKPAAQIANVHTIFNVTTALLLLPFGTLLAKAATRILPDQEDEVDQTYHLEYLDLDDIRKERKIGSAAIGTTQLRREVARMLDMVRQNVDASFLAVEEHSSRLLDEITDREEYLDFLNKEISRCISFMLTMDMPEKDCESVHGYFKITGNLERIGDHAMNLAEYAQMLEEKGLNLSDRAMTEITQMHQLCLHALDDLQGPDSEDSLRLLEKIAQTEQQMDDMTLRFRQNQMERMRSGACSGEACVIYSEMLTDFERMGDHLLNIAQEIAQSSQTGSSTPVTA